jgi:NTP pyrophosphatase (non-canonical NTP hydrolase)
LPKSVLSKNGLSRVRGTVLELNELVRIQRDFDRKLGWNKYEECRTEQEILGFMEHLILVIVDELGEISRVRKKFLRDKEGLDTSTLKKEMVDILIYAMQGSMALRMGLEKEYLDRMARNKERFLDNR